MTLSYVSIYIFKNSSIAFYLFLLVPHVLLSNGIQTSDFSLNPEKSPDLTIPVNFYQANFPMMWTENFGITKCGGAKPGQNSATLTCHHWSVYSNSWMEMENIPEACMYGPYAAIGENKKWFGGGKDASLTNLLSTHYIRTGNYTRQLKVGIQGSTYFDCAVHLQGKTYLIVRKGPF